jgi:hypothetical protein
MMNLFHVDLFFLFFCNQFFIIYTTCPSLLIYLGSMLLCIISDKQLMEKMNWFCENGVPCKWNYWMTLHPSWFEFKFNWREMRYKLMYKILKVYLGLWCWKEKKLSKDIAFKKTPFHSSLLENQLNIFQFVTIIQKDNFRT